MSEENNLRDLVAEVAAAYFSNSHVGAAEIPHVIQQIATSLAAVGVQPTLEEPAAPVQEEEPKRTTPAQIRKSITPDALISFEDGKGYKTLKRHLSTRGLTINEYKAKWGLPKDYPSVAPNYSLMRAEFAKKLGLGRKVDAPAKAKSQAPRRQRKAVSAT